MPGWMVASSGRAVLLIGAAAVGAYAVTMLVRSTVFTLGAMFAVVVGATLVMRAARDQRGVVPQQEPELGDLERRGLLRPATRRLLRRAPARGIDCNGRERSSSGRAPATWEASCWWRGRLPVVVPSA